MEEKENFVVTWRQKNAIVERNFDLLERGTLSYKVAVPVDPNGGDVTLIDLHRASADVVIRQLLRFLPEGYDKDDPYRPGQNR